MIETEYWFVWNNGILDNETVSLFSSISNTYEDVIIELIPL